MTVTRRTISFGGLGLLAATSLPPAANALDGPITDLMEGSDEFGLAVEAYIYGYPAGDDGDDPPGHHQRGRSPRAPRGPMGQFIKLREYPNACVPRRHGAQRRHALHDGLPRRRQGALGPQPPGHGRTATSCSRCSTAGPTCSRCPASAPPAPGRRPTPSPGRAGRASCREGVTEYKSPTSHGLDPRPHLLHRHAGGLRGRPRAPGRSASCMPLSAYGKDYTPPAGQGRSRDRHEDGGARPGQQHGRRRLLHAALPS